ncbi:acetate--CoA ligase family protein, partial [Myxococcota bacterium]|nr:acetate--CoA ligase family protein [Myxococcota bacterium]
MNVHEYQAKGLLRDYGVAVPEGELAETAAEAHAVASRLGGLVVVKAQIHAGGRGKGGGIKLAKNPEEAAKMAEEILGMNLVTHQTGVDGKLVRKVYVEAGSEIDRELYLAMTLDRATENFAVVASTEGGMDIEEVAEKTPEKISTTYVDPN